MDTKPRGIGRNEALVLSVLHETSTINQVCERLEGDGLDDAAVYLTLKRLLDRGLVTRRTVARIAADGKQRAVGEYTPTPQAMEALDAFYRAFAPVVRRVAAAGGLA